MKSIRNKENLFSFIKNLFLIGLGQSANLLSVLLIIPIIVARVGLDKYGLVSIAFSMMLFLSLIVDFGFNFYGINKIASKSKENDISYFLLDIIVTKILIFLFLCLLVFISFYFIEYTRKYYSLFIYSLAIPLSNALNLQWVFHGLSKFKLYTCLSIFSKFFYFLLVYFFVQVEENYEFINLFFGLSIIIVNLPFYFRLKHYGFKILSKISFRIVAKSILESYHYFLFNLSVNISISLFPAILGLYVSSEMVGVYSIIEKIYNILKNIFTIYNNTILPRLIFYYNESIEKGIILIKSTYILIIVPTVILVILVYMYRFEILLFFTKEKIELTSSLIVYVLIGVFISMLNTPAFVSLIALDRKKQISKIFSIGPLLGISFCFLLSSFFGIKGALFSILIVEFFYLISANYIFKEIQKNGLSKKN